VICLLLACVDAVHADELVGKVVKVSDGDTLSILLDSKAHPVRLTEIDAPEKEQAFGNRSRKSLAELCAGKLAKVEDKGRDRYGRILGRVYCDGIYANAEQVREEVARGQAWGIDIELVDQAEAKRLAPYADPGRALAIWWAASDVYLEPGDLPRAYLKAAESLGATVEDGTTVVGIAKQAGTIERVLTDHGEIRCKAVIDAAGAWAPAVARMAGVRLPTVPVRHQLVITEPIVGVTADMPIVRVVDANVYVRPERGGLMLGGYEPDPIAIDPETLREGISDMPLDVAPLERIIEDVTTEYPVLRDVAIAELRGGLPTMTPDGHHLFGEATEVSGFWVMSGCVVAGLSISPAAGEAMAQWITTGQPPYDMSRFRLDRFGHAYDDPEVLTRACLARYSHHYETPE